jgi:type II secretory pathway component GspD/PulD (secretin)
MPTHPKEDVMKRALAATMLLAIAFSLSTAQEGEQPDLVLGSTTEAISLAELIQLNSEMTGKVFFYNPQQFPGGISVTTSSKGAIVSPEEIDLLLQNSLEEFRLCFLPKGQQWGIYPTSLAASIAPKIAVQDLEHANPAHWATVTVPLRYAGANAVFTALRNFVDRQGGVVQPVLPSALMICERVDRLRDIVLAVREIDASMATTTVGYPLPEGISAEDAAIALMTLFPEQRGQVATFAAAPDGGQVLARASVSIQSEIAEAVKAMARE